jgi:hypothetical protein
VGTVEDLISALRETCSGLPDKRRGKNSRYDMADIGMAAFSVFFMQSPSFLPSRPREFHPEPLTDSATENNCDHRNRKA